VAMLNEASGTQERRSCLNSADSCPCSLKLHRPEVTVMRDAIEESGAERVHAPHEQDARGRQAQTSLERVPIGHSGAPDLANRAAEDGWEQLRPTPSILEEVEEHQIFSALQALPGGLESVQDVYPLSPLQEGIFFHSLLDRIGSTYVLLTFFALSSKERTERFVGALQRVIERHDILRSCVQWQNVPRPVQVIQHEARLPVEELLPRDAKDPIEYLRQQVVLGLRGWDLCKAPLMKLWLLQETSSGTWYAALQVHHLICDHQSMQILLSETMCVLNGLERTLPPPARFRDYVAQTLADARSGKAEAFLRGKLADVDEPTAPFGLLEANTNDNKIADRCIIDSDLTRRIRVQAQRYGVSSAVLLHAAWALVAAHTSRRDDVVCGTVAISAKLRNRSARAPRALGPSVNTLTLRLRLRGLSAGDLLAHTRRELKETLEHESAPPTLSRKCSGIAGTAPLFTSLLNCYRGSDTTPVDAEVRVVGSVTPSTNYSVTVSVKDFGTGLELIAQTDLRIDPVRVIGYLRRALESLVEALESAPRTPALSVCILPNKEREQVTRLFNATEAEYSLGTVHQLFEAQVRVAPDAVALVYEGGSLTYAELNGSANQLARYLLSRGAGTDELVGVCVGRGVEMVVGVLGVLKAGAAYLPLDPSYPRERLKYMLEDAAPRFLLTQEEVRGGLPATQAEVISLDAKRKEIAECGDEDLSNFQRKVDSKNLVYVIYTSGSTGRPKGTAMPHRALLNLIEWHRRTLPCEGQRVSQFSALGFDVAFQETFSTLCAGGTLVLLEEWVRRDARALTEFLSSRCIERLFVPPQMLQSLAECLKSVGSVAANLSLRDVITAGEQLRITPVISGLFKGLKGCRLHNHYGPTETHVVTALTLTGEADQWPELPSIGKPISNTQIYVLDERGQPAPLGVAGEIHIGGVGVARGYLRRAQLTAQRFIADPFSTHPQECLYKTGDLGRWRADGTLEYLGRNDDQVKIRGFRIELGEIEAHLLRHAQVREAAVVAREDTPGEKRLVAYLTRIDRSDPSAQELRAHLSRSLPEHMLPSAFVTLDSLPLTPSGKLDRRALPAPQQEAYLSREYEAPQGEVEEILAGIWQQLLGVERVGRHDNFFELGGHSLLIVRLVAAVPGLDAEAVLKFHTIRELARVVEDLSPQAGVSENGGDDTEELAYGFV
jgi:amino acid adenylation domain-containing protein